MKRRLNVADEALMSYVRGEIDLTRLYERHPSVYGRVFFDWLTANHLATELVELWDRVADDVPDEETLPPWRRQDWEGQAYLCTQCDRGFYVWDDTAHLGRCIRCLHVIASMAESRMEG
jgi:hypothetical protein